MNNTCTKCGEKYKGEGHLELSHDIPKWMGGLDLDGRRYLCKRCHSNYDKKILNDCLGWMLLQPVQTKEDIIHWQKALKELTMVNPQLMKNFKDIAHKNKIRWFGDGQ